jgi:hypothetical protein
VRCGEVGEGAVFEGGVPGGFAGAQAFPPH